MIIVMMMMMMMMIMIMMMALKGAYRDFLQFPHCASNCLQHVAYVQVTRAQSCATYRVLITCNMSYATWYEGITQLLSLTALSYFSFIILAETIHR